MGISFAQQYAIRADPNTTMVMDSNGAGWTSVYAAKYLHEGTAEPFETVATPHQKITVVAAGTLEMASRKNGRWPMSTRGAGSIGFTPAGRIDNLRWRALESSFETVHLYVPEAYFASAVDEYRRIGQRYDLESLNGTGITDDLVAQLVTIIADAAIAGMPVLYAEAASHFLAAHMVRLHCGLSSAAEDGRRSGFITTSRLANVIAFMRANYMRPLSLEQLASEAGVTPHHFAHLFKNGTGLPPHRFLMDLRLDAAARLLDTTDKSIFEIALESGYFTSSHFSEAFRRKFRTTPTTFRAEARGAKPDRSL